MLSFSMFARCNLQSPLHLRALSVLCVKSRRIRPHKTVRKIRIADSAPPPQRTPRLYVFVSPSVHCQDSSLALFFAPKLPITHCPLPTLLLTLLHFPFWPAFLFNHFRTLLLFCRGRGVQAFLSELLRRHRYLFTIFTSLLRFASLSSPVPGRHSPNCANSTGVNLVLYGGEPYAPTPSPYPFYRSSLPADSRRYRRLGRRSRIPSSHPPRTHTGPDPRSGRLLRPNSFHAPGLQRPRHGRRAAPRLESHPAQSERKLGHPLSRCGRQSRRRHRPIRISSPRRVQRRDDGRPRARCQRRLHGHVRLAGTQRHLRRH